MATKKTKGNASPTPKAEKKRADILKAAGRCFRRTGFHLASMQEICAETELGPGAVYRYFPSKDAIIEAMAEDERASARALLAELSPGADLAETLGNIGRMLFERYRHALDAGMMTEVYAEGLRNKKVGAIVKKMENDWVDGLAGLLAAAQSAGQLDAATDPRHAALLLTAMWDGMVIRQAYHLDDRSTALEAYFDAMVKRMFAQGEAATVAAAPMKAAEKKPPRTVAVPVVEMPAAPTEKDLRQMSLI